MSSRLLEFRSRLSASRAPVLGVLHLVDPKPQLQALANRALAIKSSQGYSPPHPIYWNHGLRGNRLEKSGAEEVSIQTDVGRSPRQLRFGAICAERKGGGFS